MDTRQQRGGAGAHAGNPASGAADAGQRVAAPRCAASLRLLSLLGQLLLATQLVSGVLQPADAVLLHQIVPAGRRNNGKAG